MQSFKVKISLLLAILLWASAFVGIRIGLLSYSPGALALFRFLIASVLMGFLYVRQHSDQKVPWSIRLQLGLLGVLGIGAYNVCLNYGEQTVSAGIASFVIGLAPALTILFAVLFLKERPTVNVYLGILISLFGLLLMVAGGGESGGINYNVLLIFVSALISGAYSLLQKPYLRHYHPVVVTSWIIWGGTLAMMIFAPRLYNDFFIAKSQATWAIVYLGIFPAAIAYLAWSYVLKALSASYASIYLYSMPIVSSLLGFLILHEKPTLLSLCGGSLALIGAFYASRAPQQ